MRFFFDHDLGSDLCEFIKICASSSSWALKNSNRKFYVQIVDKLWLKHRPDFDIYSIRNVLSLERGRLNTLFPKHTCFSQGV